MTCPPCHGQCHQGRLCPAKRDLGERTVSLMPLVIVLVIAVVSGLVWLAKDVGLIR